MTRGLLVATPAAAIGAAWMVRHQTSSAVRSWRPSALNDTRAGELHVRCGGDSGPVTVLLHGLVATGDVFGSDFDPLTRTSTLVVPDLLGFGRSLDETRGRFEPDDHLDALDNMLVDLGLDQRPLRLGAHSMGGAVAIRWAQRRGSQVERVVCWGPPVYASAHAVDAAVADSGVMARLFVANTRWARAACKVNCSHRALAGLAATALTPSLPVPIARAASLHTWPAYRDAMVHLVRATDWRSCLRTARAARTEVELVWGAADSIGALATTFR